MAIELIDALSQLVTISVTTGASPTDIPLQSPPVSTVIVNVTTGGTGGVEVLNLPTPTLNGDGVNIAATGQRYIMGVVTQTDPGDVVKLTNDGADAWFLYTPTDLYLAYYGLSSVLLDFGGATAGAIWQNYQWGLDIAVSADNFTPQVDTPQVTFQAATPTTGPGGDVTVKATSAVAGSDGKGGDIVHQYGTGDGAGRNGLWFPHLPTADPHVAGAAWANSGVVTISAG